MIYKIAPNEAYDEYELDGMSHEELDLLHAKARKLAGDYDLRISDGSEDYENGGPGLENWEYKETKRLLMACKALYKTIELIQKQRGLAKKDRL